MRHVLAFGRFWWDFVVGAGLGLTGLLTALGVDAWWLLPLVVAFALGASLWRATRTSGRFDTAGS